MTTTVGKPVYRADGTRLYGLDAELELKMQAKRDPEFERKLLDWVGAVTNTKFPSDAEFGVALKNGIALCNLANALQPGIVKKIETKAHPLMERANIEEYRKACWKLDIPSSCVFAIGDLHDLKAVASVVANVHAMARLAATLSSFKGPLFEGAPALPKPIDLTDNKTARKWAPVETAPRISHVLDIEASIKEGNKEYSSSFDGEQYLHLLKRLATYEADMKAMEDEIEETSSHLDGALHAIDRLEATVADLKTEISTGDSSKKLSTGGDVTSSVEFTRLMQTVSMLQNRLENLEKGKATNPQLEKPPVSVKTTPEDDSSQWSIKAAQMNQSISSLKERMDSVESAQEDLRAKLTTQDRMRDITNTTPTTTPTPSGTLARKPTTSRSQPRMTMRGTLRGTKGLELQPERPGPDALVFMQQVLSMVLFSREIDFASVELANELFRSDVGQREFTRILRRTMKEVTTLELSNTSFELILYLVSSFLETLSNAEAKDFISARIVMATASSLSRSLPDGSQDYLRNYLKGHSAFMDLAFWDDYFVGTLHKQLGDSTDVDDIAVAATHLLTDYGHKMREWGVEDHSVRQFINDLCQRYMISQPERQKILDDIRQMTENPPSPSKVGGKDEHKDEKDKRLQQKLNQGRCQLILLSNHDHVFIKFYATSTLRCQYCDKFILALTSAQRCKVCEQPAHRACAEKLGAKGTSNQTSPSHSTNENRSSRSFFGFGGSHSSGTNAHPPSTSNSPSGSAQLPTTRNRTSSLEVPTNKGKKTEDIKTEERNRSTSVVNRSQERQSASGGGSGEKEPVKKTPSVSKTPVVMSAPNTPKTDAPASIKNRVAFFSQKSDP
eukprot:comp20980_c0_seq1/m.28101 comp20980_c0_seq1/g.28101  ORF comp20980_c0_seq1/g.28101 comp20980_c0_seq1/m.28101 type:complete len:844 (-) comp20980_c0_seq1:581-3112(-)